MAFSAAVELSPATRYRRKLALRLLGIVPHNASVRMPEIGSGAGQFAEEFLAHAPRAQFLGLELSRTGVRTAAHRTPARFLQRDLLAPGRDLVAKAVRAPTLLMRAAGAVFAALFRLNLMHPWGWQTPAVARYRGS